MVCQECKSPGHTKAYCLNNFKNIVKIKEKKEECTICLEQTRQMQCETICGHRFHIKCIKKWLSNHSTCPICRHVLVERKHMIDTIISDIINEYLYISSYIENENLI